MSWFQRLYETYPNAVIASQDSEYAIAPIAHKHQNVNIEIQLNNSAEIETIRILPEEDTIVPITGDNNCNWGLAINLRTYFNEKKLYQKQLQAWAVESGNKKIAIINNYIRKGTLINDLLEKNIIIKKYGKDGYAINKSANTKQKEKYGEPFIRWIVGFDKNGNTWENQEIIKSWQKFINKRIQEEDINKSKEKLCYITAKKTSLTEKHPYANRTAKLIASEDKKNFVFNGKFEYPNEVVGIGYEVSQKAHNMLHWLMAEERGQAYLNGEQKFVAWTSKLSILPRIGESSKELIEENISGDVGSHYGKALKEKIKGYSSKLEPNENTMVIGIDSANPGRTSVIYYRELLGSKFFDNIEIWHNKYSWEQYLYIKKDERYKYFIGTPSLDVIANYYLYKKDKYVLEKNQKKIKKRIIKDLIPTVIECRDIPKYIENQFIKKASNPVALSNTQWKTILRIACAIYKGNKYKEDYKMCLDETNRDRNYLYGRILAILDSAEYGILQKQYHKDRKHVDDGISESEEHHSDNKGIRLTNAKRFMTKFSITPATTWKLLYEKFMQAYRAKLKGNWIEDSIKEVIALNPSAFETNNNSPLNGDYLLGYFCQLKRNSEDKKKSIAKEKQSASENKRGEQ
ncbi:MAG: type I-C CRISPR-associated protein Cas8c/Csd1 [Rickettsiales bacterium]|jgi:CRISPR-associated protein Csd1|nr:type I-C CRISPR-associated protein Cas8c/Csd1 [Rickettsiales bacterium]